MSCSDAWHRAGLANAGTYLFWPRNGRSFFHLLPTTPESACARNATLTQSLRRLVWKFSSPDRPRAMTHACRPGHVFRVVSERPDRKQIMQVIAGGPASGRYRFTLSESGAIAGFFEIDIWAGLWDAVHGVWVYKPRCLHKCMRCKNIKTRLPDYHSRLTRNAGYILNTAIQEFAHVSK
jgi:hypothetical protein